MREYLKMLKHVVDNGEIRQDRTGTGTRSVFGYQARYDLSGEFPLVTTKRVNFAAIVAELLWFLSGSTNTNTLDSKIWDEWADSNGDLGPIYGKQWRDFGGVDQISSVIAEIKANPTSRRLVVSAWNPPELPKMALPPCHCLFQFYVRGEYLDCQLYQRSGDVFLGVPFNIASYSLLTLMVAQICDLSPGEFVHTIGDLHLYNNHIEQANKQLAREPRPLPTVRLNPAIRDIFEFTASDIELENYRPHSAIPAPVSV